MNTLPDKVTDEDDFFFSHHGVGDVPLPVDEDLEAVASSLNPQLATAAEVDFCRRIIKGESKADAYIGAFGFQGNELKRDSFATNARRLLKRPRVARKYLELRKKVEEFAEEDLATLVHQLNEDRQLARDLGQPGAAITAVKTKAELLGLGKKEGGDRTTINLNLSDGQKSALLDRIGHKLLDRVNPAVEDADYKDITDES